ncbi:MAG: class I SAM-dependent methyltransferase [Mariprofundaceae bacterium]|nr:class I SAM-dependent methyltransferase [Mariprofundaceae bacterium]
MNEQQRKRIIDKHRDSLTRHGYHPHALYWSGRDIQEVRFQMLANIGIASGDSVLDVGCGFGDFKSWSEQQDSPLQYTGIDLSPDLLAQAKGYHQDAVFFTGDLFDMSFENKSFDWVILSGALNEQLHDESAYAKSIIARMYQLCRKGTAFNMLDARALTTHDLHSQTPKNILIFCQKLSPNCSVIDDYLANDFTIYMMR